MTTLQIDWTLGDGGYFAAHDTLSLYVWLTREAGWCCQVDDGDESLMICRNCPDVIAAKGWASAWAVGYQAGLKKGGG